MQISPDGIALRDEKVFRFAREKKIPIVMLTSGFLFSPSLPYVCHDVCTEKSHNKGVKKCG